MRMIHICFLSAMFLLLFTCSLIAQEKLTYPRIGFIGDLILPTNEFWGEGTKLSYDGRGFVRFYINRQWKAEVGAEYVYYAGLDFNRSYYRTNIFPLDGRIQFTFWRFQGVKVSLYGGIGGLYYRVVKLPETQSPVWTRQQGFAAYLPFGLKIEFPFSRTAAFEITGGWNYSSTDYLNYYKWTTTGFTPDGWMSIGAGFTFSLPDMMKKKMTTQ